MFTSELPACDTPLPSKATCTYKYSADRLVLGTLRDFDAFTAPNHEHNFIQLWYVRQGMMRHTYGNITYIQKQGNLIIVPPLFEHALDTSFTKGTTEVFQLDISEQMIFDAVDQSTSDSLFDLIYLLPLLTNSNMIEPGLCMTHKTAAQIESILVELSEHNNNIHELCSEKIPKIFTELLRIIAKEYQSTLMLQYIELLEKYRDVMQNSFQYIKQNFMQKKLRMDQICKRVLMSKTPFYSVFKLATSKPPNEYLRHLRIMYACELLLGTDLSLYEISCECGFTDQTDLGRVFKQIWGISPKQYREFYAKNKV